MALSTFNMAAPKPKWPTTQATESERAEEDKEEREGMRDNG